MAHVIQFVDSIASSPTTRLDINDASTYTVLRAGIDLSPPGLRRVQVANMMRDGAEIPASAYENRRVRFTVKIVSTTEDALATAVQSLDRELDRRVNILKWQSHGATNPVFFRTFRSPDYQRERPDPQGFVVLVDLDIVAEPFAYGLQETIINAQTITNDPAAGSNPQYIDTAATVKGDVPTPAYVETTGVAALASQYLAVRRHGTPVDLMAQCEDLTNVTDATDVVDASFSAGDGVRITPGTTTMVTRLTWDTFPIATPTAEYRGIYRVFLRVKKNTAGDTWKVRQAHNSGGLTAYGPTVTAVAGIATRHVLDLGLVQVPAGHDPVFNGYSNVQWPFENSQLIIQAERTAGSGTLDIDYIRLVPADEELAIATAQGTAATFLWDGPMDAIRAADGSTTMCAFTRAGSIPLLAPNQVNRIYCMKGLGMSDDIAGTTTITVKYWPRWLNVARPT